MNGYISLIHNCQELEATKMSYIRRIEEQTVIHPCSGTLFGNKRKSAVKPQKTHKVYILYDSKYLTLWKRKNYRYSRKSTSCWWLGWGERDTGMNRWSTGDFLGSETILSDSIMVGHLSKLVEYIPPRVNPNRSYGPLVNKTTVAKRNELFIHLTAWMNLQGIVPSEKSQSQKVIWCMIYLYNIF